MRHDEHCEAKADERKGWHGRHDCNCAQRAYERDPLLDDDGNPIPLGTPHKDLYGVPGGGVTWGSSGS